MPSNWKKALCHKYDINQKMRCHREPHGRHQKGWKVSHQTLKNHWWNITWNWNELEENVQLPAKLRLTKTSEYMKVPIYNSFIGERGGGSQSQHPKPYPWSQPSAVTVLFCVLLWIITKIVFCGYSAGFVFASEKKLKILCLYYVYTKISSKVCFELRAWTGKQW